jgi:coenzyme F420 hydrogenase subunit beta
MEKTSDQSVFIGKPCDVSGLRPAHNINPQLAEKTALAIGFFCAGTPSTQGTLELLKSQGIDPTSITDFRYRGIGWPGMATAHFKDQAKPPFKLTYQESWGFVKQYRPFRCYLCPDPYRRSSRYFRGRPMVPQNR